MKVITVGRSKDNNNVVVNDEKVSRNHLQIIQDDHGCCCVIDLGSTNGTFVNGQRISQETPLHSGDELRIGSTILPWERYLLVRNDTASPLTTPILSPTPKVENTESPRSKWWLWVVVGIVAVMVIGGISWWIYSKSTPAPEPIPLPAPRTSLDSLRIAAYQSELELQKTQKEEALLKAQRDSLAKIDISNLSKREKDALEAEKVKLGEQILKKEKERGELQTELGKLNGQITSLERQLEKTRDSLKDANKGIIEANNAKNEANRKNNLILEMQEILNGWNESTAAAFCDKQSPKWSYADKKEAKNAIVKKFKTLDENAMKQKVNEMRNFKKKEDAKPTESAPKTPSLQTPTESQPDTNKTKE